MVTDRDQDHIQPSDPERITELARDIVTDRSLVVDLERHEWAWSLALVAPELLKFDNLGMILVPVAPHMTGHWVNGVAPAVTVSCIPVAVEDLPAIDSAVQHMSQALGW